MESAVPGWLDASPVSAHAPPAERQRPVLGFWYRIEDLQHDEQDMVRGRRDDELHRHAWIWDLGSAAPQAIERIQGPRDDLWRRKPGDCDDRNPRHLCADASVAVRSFDVAATHRDECHHSPEW